MTKRANKTGRSEKAAPHARLYYWFTDCPAWASLTAGARATYLLLLRRYKGSNNGKIPLSVREVAAELRAGKSTAAGYLDELQERGFIEVMTRGAFANKNAKATEWKLNEYPCDVTGELPSKAFMRWMPGRNLTVRPGVPTVPVAEPIGTCSRTVRSEQPANGTCSRTVARRFVT